MKSFNQIVFLLSFATVGTVFSMEEYVPAKSGKEFVEVDNKLVEYYTGNNIRYYGEYRAQQRDNNIVSFPVESTDPLPIEYCGNTRFFVTSATTGTQGRPGEGYTILDPAIKQLAVVRCVAQSNNYGANVYLGLDTDNFKSVGYKGRNRIYSARVMAIQTKEKSCDRYRQDYYDGSSWYHSHPMGNEVRHFGNAEIGQEVRKHIDKEFWNWNSPVMQAQVKELLGQRAKDFHGQSFYFQKNYWTQEENKLKGITYHSAKK
ncbi:MAG TPA: hypothetical protein VKR54_01330 [Candidatus Babeliales bacterium]|jgi:hypothetical protein|nr:hypothetical protein [Candidatus Babeliales bacterium]